MPPTLASAAPIGFKGGERSTEGRSILDVADPRRRADADRKSLADALVRVGQGDRAAFHEVYRRTAPKLLGICLRILQERSEAEDAVQDVYLTIWRRADRFDPERASPITWLATIARNGAIDRLRARGGRSLDPIDAAATVADTAPDAEAVIAERDEQGRLVQCFGTLEPRDAGFIRSAFFEGATYAELAGRAGQPLGSIKSRIRRALIRLRECLSS